MLVFCGITSNSIESIDSLKLYWIPTEVQRISLLTLKSYIDFQEFLITFWRESIYSIKFHEGPNIDIFYQLCGELCCHTHDSICSCFCKLSCDWNTWISKVWNMSCLLWFQMNGPCHLTHLGPEWHMCREKYYSPSDAYMCHKYLYFSYSLRGDQKVVSGKFALKLWPITVRTCFLNYLRCEISVPGVMF